MTSQITLLPTETRQVPLFFPPIQRSWVDTSPVTHKGDIYNIIKIMRRLPPGQAQRRGGGEARQCRGRSASLAAAAYPATHSVSDDRRRDFYPAGTLSPVDSAGYTEALHAAKASGRSRTTTLIKPPMINLVMPSSFLLLFVLVVMDSIHFYFLDFPQTFFFGFDGAPAEEELLPSCFVFDLASSCRFAGRHDMRGAMTGCRRFFFFFIFLKKN